MKFEKQSAREAKIIAQIVGVRWAEKNAGRATGLWVEAYFFLVPLSGIAYFFINGKSRRKRTCRVELNLNFHPIQHSPNPQLANGGNFIRLQSKAFRL